jgi:hypothetical protein
MSRTNRHRLVRTIPSAFWAAPIGLLIGLAASCSTTETVLNPDHCANNDGDAYCAENFPDKPLCSSGKDECSTGDKYGCVTAEDLDDSCHVPCGNDDPNCEGVVDDSSSGTTDGPETSTSMGPTTASVTDTDDDSDTDTTDTTADTCRDPGDCTDLEAPFCSPTGTCVPCDVLDNPDDSCATVYPDTPVCDAGTCVQCTSAKPEACDGPTPVCGQDLTCTACTEHFECDDSACHLDGPDQGACFDVDSVIEVGNTAQLNTAISGLSGTDQAVIVLTGGDYSSVQVELLNSLEVAIIGTGNAEISGNTGSGLVAASGNAILYLSNLVVRSNGSGHGVTCSGTSLWADDSVVRSNNGQGLSISGGCEAHLRRTVVRGNSGGGISVDNAELAMRNSAVIANLNAGSLSAIRIISSAVDITYSTIVNNVAVSGIDNIECLSNPSGSVRNSIVLAANSGSISGCGSIDFSGNAVDQNGLGGDNVNVGVYNSTWFDDADNWDFRISPTGEPIFMDIAEWQAGDPLTDIDGNPIPTEMPSFPGFHQP